MSMIIMALKIKLWKVSKFQMEKVKNTPIPTKKRAI